MYNLTWAVILLPLGGILAAWLVESPRRAAQMVAAATAAAFVLSLVVLGYRLGHVRQLPYQSLLTFWTFDPGQQFAGGFISDFHLQVGILVDALAAVMLAVAALVSLLVQVHSIGFMRGDAGQARYATTCGLMTFAILALIASPNLFQLYVMWELLGLGGFLLVGHWWHRPAAVTAARRLFLVTRIGDLALLLGLFAIFTKFAGHVAQQPLGGGQPVNDPFSFLTLNGEWTVAHLGRVTGVGGRSLVIIAVLVLVGVLGKAAQIPLHTWLPASVEAPTPGSALLQSATLTLAGGYLLARMEPLFLVAPHVLSVVALLGAAGAVLGAVAALVHTDIRRVLAWSTMSSLGLVLVAFGVGAYGAAVFQLFAHAWVKALLLLGAANLIQAYRTHDITEMGGAWRRMRWTSMTMLLGCASLAGVVLLTGFWSDSSVLAGVLRNTFPTGGHVGRAVQALVLVGVLLALALTALYPFRMFFLAVLGDPVRRRRFQPERVREAPGVQVVPLLVMLVPAALAGFVALPGARESFARLVYVGAVPQNPGANGVALAVAAVLPLLGVAAAYSLWGRRVPAPGGLTRRLEPVRRAALAGFGFDAAYAWAVSTVLLRPAPLLPRFDEEFTGAVGRAVTEGLEEVSAASSRAAGGRLSGYALTAVAGTVLIVGGITLAATGHFPGVGAAR